ncbi:MAG TPA: HEAT repeat domain-containing protein [Pyrinomonadaceae bacterium]|nr:HEAT repeat domain-containing protein [Pyrinomonadaceae bacterium]
MRTAVVLALSLGVYSVDACAQKVGAGVASFRQSALTPLQGEIEKQKSRLSSGDQEERRDAVMRLGAMARPESARAASVALTDSSAVVRATAARAVLPLGPGEASNILIPLLRDRDEFVRREAAYALGLTRSRKAAPALVNALEADKQPSVRGAAAVALGQVAEPSTVPALAAALARRLPASGFFNRIRRKKVEEDEFVRRSVAISLGQIGSREGVPALIAALSDERAPDDIRREAARSLGILGDPSAVPVLRSVLDARDPYLARIAFEALRKLDPSTATRPA